MVARIVFPIAVFVAILVYAWVALGYPAMSLQRGFGPGFFPLIIAFLVAVLAAIEIANQAIALIRRRARSAVQTTAVKLDLGVNLRELTYTAILAASVITAVLAIRPLGFVAASAALVGVLTIAMGTRSPWQAIAAGVIASGSIYIIFAKGFGVVLAF